MTRIDQLKDPRYLRHPRLKDRPLGVLTHPHTVTYCNMMQIFDIPS